ALPRQDVAEGRHRDGPLCADLQFNTCTEYRRRREDDGSYLSIGGGAPKPPHSGTSESSRVAPGRPPTFLPRTAHRRKFAPYDPPELSWGHMWGSWASPSRFHTAWARCGHFRKLAQRRACLAIDKLQ